MPVSHGTVPILFQRAVHALEEEKWFLEYIGRDHWPKCV